VRIALLLTNAASVDGTWTSMHLAAAALRAGHELFVLEPMDFEITGRGRLVARAWTTREPPESVAALATALTRQRLPRRHIEFSTIDQLLMRVNPLTPTSEQFCLLAKERGVNVINDPAGTALTRAKAWLASLPDDVPRPRTLVTGSRAEARSFLESGGVTVVLKPAAGSGGRHVTLVPPRRRDLLERALAQVGARGGTHVVIQEYLPEARNGEKRIIWVDGELLGAYQRDRAPGDFRHNLKQGARPVACELDEADETIRRAIGPHLQRNGIRIAGLDVIGGRLVEVNTLNPGGIHWADALGTRPPGWIADRAISLLTREPSAALKDGVDV
jgi:glutathione synthase